MNWETDLFECHRAKDVGLTCCLNHICCGICIWGDALRVAGVKDAGVYVAGAAAGTVLSTNQHGVGALGQAGVMFSSIAGRIKLAKKYGIEEDTFATLFARGCCMLCAQVQEVNHVIVNEKMTYGFAALKLQEEQVTTKGSGGNGGGGSHTAGLHLPSSRGTLPLKMQR